jgi:xanthine dehydrogenase YagR molybdenum-binding subunit
MRCLPRLLRCFSRLCRRDVRFVKVCSEHRLPEARGALFVGDFDDEASPLGAKGGALGELTAVSVAPAIANAIYHATGKRVRDLPIAVEKLL